MPIFGLGIHIWALGQGDLETANAQRKEIEHSKKYWKKHTHDFNRALLRRLDAVFAARGN